MDKLRGMQVFLEVTKLKSFSGAATRLEMSPAMVSKHISALEKDLNVRLINRSTRHVSLTEVGNAYRVRCGQILGDLEEAETSIRALNDMPRGRLSIGAPIVFGARHIATILPDYMEHHPEIDVRLYLREVSFDPLHDGVDVDIRIGHLADSNLVARQLATAYQVVCASPTYVARHGVPKTVSGLARHNCVQFSGTDALDAWQFMNEGGEPETFPVTGNFRSNSGSAIYYAVLNGMGVAMLPSYMVVDDLKSGRLEAIELDRIPVELPIWAVYAYRQHLSAKVRTFIEFARTRVAQRVSGQTAAATPEALETEPRASSDAP